MREEAKQNIIQQRKYIAEKRNDIMVYDDTWSTPIKDKLEQELHEAKHLLKSLIARYKFIVESQLTELYEGRKTINIRIDAMPSYDLDLEEDLMAIDSAIVRREKEAEELGVSLEPMKP